ncbi:hypothetical protein J7E68_14035, partial [Microbacterium sp. ISL-103]|nr:hypothetical protein [Microbacterium sp. ISL-103]
MSKTTGTLAELPSETRTLAVGAGRGRKSAPRKLRSIAWSAVPALVFVAIVAAWAGLVAIFDIPAYLLPGPAAVAERLVVDFPSLWEQTTSTLVVLSIGLVL